MHQLDDASETSGEPGGSASGDFPRLVLGTFFLRRQSLLLEGALFEVGQIGGWIASEARAQDSGVVALSQALACALPGPDIDSGQIGGADRGQAGERGGEEAHRAAHDQAGRGDLAAGGAPLMVALGPEELLQAVVGRR